MNAAVVLLPNCSPRFPTTIFSAASTETKYWKSNLLQKQDGASSLLSRRNLLPPPLWRSIRSNGNRRDSLRLLPGRNSATSKPRKGDSHSSNQYSFQSSDDESSSSSNQEEIIALFKRIQSSISKSGSPVTQKRSPEHSNKNQSASSVLGVLLQPRKQQLEDKSSNKFENKELPQRTAVPSEGENMEDNSPRLDFKLTRPPSNFVKRSSIQTPSTPIQEVVEVTSVVGSSAGLDSKELKKVEDMKVSELKEFAKSKGLKGYSKLNKGELVELLKGL